MSEANGGLEKADVDPFGEDPAGPGEEVQQEPEFNPWGLRNTDPPVTPAEVGQEMDVGADWHDHLFCGFIKQSGGSGTEAWMHYVMAVVLLYMSLQEGDEEQAGEGDPGGDLEEQDTSAGTGTGGITYDGPQ